MASTSAGIQAVKSTSAIFGAVVLAGASSPSFARADSQVANERERLEFIKEQGCKNVKAQALNLKIRLCWLRWDMPVRQYMTMSFCKKVAYRLNIRLVSFF